MSNNFVEEALELKKIHKEFQIKSEEFVEKHRDSLNTIFKRYSRVTSRLSYQVYKIQGFDNYNEFQMEFYDNGGTDFTDLPEHLLIDPTVLETLELSYEKRLNLYHQKISKEEEIIERKTLAKLKAKYEI